MTTALPQGGLPVERLCALAGVSRAGYYRHWQASAPRREETAVRDAIQRVALAHRHYGYRRIAAQLRREGMAVNRKRVLRLMREDNLLRLRRRPFVPVTTASRHAWRVVPNLARGMAPIGLDQLWVADITYLRLAEAFAYLAVVIDAFSRRVVGWALESHLEASLALAALEMALATRRPAPDSLIHHSDRGVQYACGDYTAKLAAHRIQPSMSRVGNPYDNAKSESFMKTLKQEEVDGRDYRDIGAAPSPSAASSRRSTTGSASIPPSAIDHPSSSRQACRRCASLSVWLPTRSGPCHDRRSSQNPPPRTPTPRGSPPWVHRDLPRCAPPASWGRSAARGSLLWTTWTTRSHRNHLSPFLCLSRRVHSTGITGNFAQRQTEAAGAIAAAGRPWFRGRATSPRC